MLKKDYSKYKWELLFCFSILIFFVGYGLVFDKIIINDDSLPRVYYGRYYSKGLGRPLGTFLTNTVAYGVNNPIFTSIVTWATLLISSVYTIKIFEVKRIRTMLAICATFFTFPIYGVYWRFGTDMWLYTLTTALTVYGMYSILKNNNKMYGAIAIVLSLAIYQAEVGILTMLFSFYYIDKCFKDELDIKQMITNLITIIISLISYFLLLKIFSVLSPFELSSYKDASSIGFSEIITNFIPNIFDSYMVYIAYISGHITYFDYFHIPVFWMFFNLVIVIYFLNEIMTIKINKQATKIWLLLLVLTIPISMNSQQMITSDFMSRTLFGNLILTIYIVIILLERIQLNQKLTVTIVTISLFMNLNSLTTIELASLSLQEENLKIGNQILADLRSFPSYDSESQIAMCGSISEGGNYNFPRVYPYVFNRETFTEVEGLTYSFFMTYPNNNEYGIALNTQLFQFLGEEVNIVYNECDSTAPSFPENGYIYEKDGIININYGSKQK